jgi:pimeloyl-ACP methyl ester carboxylesterase
MGIGLMVVDAGHFVWEEAPTEYASIILEAIMREGGR